MRILVLVGDIRYARTDISGNVSSDVQVVMHPVLQVRKGGTVIDFAEFRADNEVEKLHGMTYDIVIEGDSFNPESSYAKAQLLDLVRKIVLR